jgi:hypothetical protein
VTADRTYHWAATSDGRTWRRVPRGEATEFEDVGEVCVPAGTCYRVVPDDRVEVRQPDGAWRTAYRFTDDQREARSERIMTCASEVEPFTSIALVGIGAAARPVVNMGPDGVLVERDGRWERRAVLGAQPTRLDGDPDLADALRLVPFGAVVVLTVALLAVWLVKRRWSRTLLICLAALIGVFFGTTFLMMSRLDFTVEGPLLVVLTVGAIIAGWAGARFFPRRTYRGRPLPMAAWYPDPEHAGMLRWWDGSRWTEWRERWPQ